MKLFTYYYLCWHTITNNKRILTNFKNYTIHYYIREKTTFDTFKSDVCACSLCVCLSIVTNIE